MSESLKNQIKKSSVIPSKLPDQDRNRGIVAGSLNQLPEIYMIKKVLQTAINIQEGSITIVKQDNQIIQVNIKEIIDLNAAWSNVIF